ncbi:MAG TPA: outer membrane protein assembly factor BamA [Thiobacillaceae bacterium]|nr:outer membrane protein assembly factor BamA [Thiobacillaceae bacterium]HNA82019.1 outer membrane protein assembly factor BamA [Thiobacillaceae bacterium]HNF89022.1 outer membrane protein assembly factor BamA [Thiobacillaceae bacterium]HNH89186.1 outer membrane protein assembly factor BamA [Thiobacillaceae bacterium]HNI08180.1 outer membrane protein assembly factor BamA [Thiobacillaceae bacterium]
MSVFRPSLLALALFAAQAHAFEPFQVKDIRVEGIQRTEAGTVFSYLPVKVGETLTPEKASEAIKALYATGFFKDVRLETSNDVLLVTVEERPGIASVDFTGMKEFSKEEIVKGLKDLGLAEGRILDKSLLDKAEQELKRQYFNRGMYAVQVKATTSPLERNRVAVNFDITEGEVAKIRAINIVGAKVFKEKDLLKLLNLSTPGWMTWWTKNDQYSKQKLAGDLETLRSHYLNQGYLEFAIDSTQVSITPDKKDIYITVNVSEGEKYTVSEFRMAGDLPVPEAELKALVTLKPGDVFSREKLNESTKAIGDRLGNDGYAFANVNAAPEIDKEKRTASFTFLVDPGRKVYVRRVNVTGNTKTKDEVVRREMRQMEGGWYAADKVNRSRERVERLGYFKDTTVETPPVPGTTDQVDVNVNVTEQATGSVLLGAGFSSTDGLVLSGSISQNNLFGSGNRLSLQINGGSVNRTYALSFTNPYFTQDGISLGYDIYRKDVDTSSLNSVVDYTTSTLGLGLRVGVPITELDTVNLGLALEQVTLDLGATAPDVYYKYAGNFDANCATQASPLVANTGCSSTTNTLRLEAGWARDTRDSLLYPTKGVYQRAYMEAGTPLGDLKYYKLNYQYQWLKPLSKNVSLLLNGEVGIGGGYSGGALPLFRNFFAGGIGSVRGFDTGAIGPKAVNSGGSTFSIGGDKRLVGNAELLFPFPGAGNDRSLRLSAFLDAGVISGPDDHLGRYKTLSADGLRYSLGMAVTWYSPMGPIKLSLAQPLNAASDDKDQMFQFQLGNVF